MKVIELHPWQKTSADLFFSGKDRFELRGRGEGKTFLLGYIASHLMKSDSISITLMVVPSRPLQRIMTDLIRKLSGDSISRISSDFITSKNGSIIHFVWDVDRLRGFDVRRFEKVLMLVDEQKLAPIGKVSDIHNFLTMKSDGYQFMETDSVDGR